MIKDLHFFSRVIVVQDFETLTFYVLFVSKPTSVIVCRIKKLVVSSQFNSFFILYICKARPFSLLVSEDKQTQTLVSFDPADV